MFKGSEAGVRSFSYLGQLGGWEWGRRPFCFRSSTDWMRPTHISENSIFY